MGKNLSKVKEERVPIQLDRVRYLKFGFGAFSILEEKFGSLELALNALTDGKMSTIRLLLWAGLQDDLAEDEVMTEKQLEKMLSLRDLPMLMEALQTAIMSAMPEEETKGKNV